MKTKHMAKWAVLALTAMLAWACSDPVSNTNTGGGAAGDTPPGTGSVGGTDAAKITFEGTTVNLTSGDVYSPKADLTTPDAGLTVSQDSSFFYAGSKSLKLTATVQQDKYDTTANVLNSPPKVTEFGARIKVGTIANAGATLDLTDKVVTVRIFVPTGSPTTAVQVALQSNYQQAISPALSVTAGKWTSLSFKADSTKLNASGKLMFTSVTSAGAYDKNGAYSSATFDATAVDQVEIRAVGGAVGAAGTMYIDSIDWAAAATPSQAAAPTFSPAAGTYSTTQSVSLATTTSGASIRYNLTSDGSTPADPTSTTGTVFDAASPISLAVPATGTKTYILKAIAVSSGIADSGISTATYTLNAASYTVTFDPNYTGSTTTTASVAAGGTATVPTAPTQAGYGFNAWYTDAACTPSSLYSFSTAVNADLTLYAKWNTKLQTFDGATAPTLGTMNYNSPGIVVTPALVAAAGTANTGKALLVMVPGYDSVPVVSVTLPATKVLADFAKIRFKYYGADGDSAYKPISVFATTTYSAGAAFSKTLGTGGLIAATTGNTVTGKASWQTVDIDLTGATASASAITALTGQSLFLGIGPSINGGVYYLDDIAVVDGSGTETVLADFSTDPSTLGAINWNASSLVVNLPDLAKATTLNAKALMVLNKNYNTSSTFTATLPTGKLLSNYKAVKASVFAATGDSSYKTGLLFASDYAASTKLSVAVTGSNWGTPSLAATPNLVATAASATAALGAWTTATFDLTSATTASSANIAGVTTTSLDLSVGMHANKAVYFIDEVELVD